jgi:hypothetical protein
MNALTLRPLPADSAYVAVAADFPFWHTHSLKKS